MLELFSSGLVAVWLEMAGINPAGVDATQSVAWRGAPLLSLSTADPIAEDTMRQYLKGWSAKGLVAANQGVWMQSGPLLLANNQGKTPLPAASLTKIATSVAALHTWGPAHQFETQVGTTGIIKDGVVQGDLVITGSGDPFFVWEEAIAVGNALNRLGVRRVTGSLIIVGDFYMNYQPHPGLSGILLKQGFDSNSWSREAKMQYSRMPLGTPRPQLMIAKGIKVSSTPISQQTLLLRHQSIPLTEILKEMNIYSNNEMAQMLAKSVGGATVVAQLAAKSADVPLEEIQLINGSGLGVKNRISPRAACAMLMAIERYLKPYNLTVGDLFPVSGRDHRGTLSARHIPLGTVIKTGTLNQVSALAGVMPTRDRGLVWFAIINRGGDVEGFRTQQDQMLQHLLQQWGVPPTLPVAILPSPKSADVVSRLGDTRRILPPQF